jgi:pimeloyl-ACP methyl ester carboxylesterase
MRLHVNQIEIEVEDTGEATRPAVLLIMGLGMQLIGWPDGFWQGLHAAGFRVIRMDNRDAGLSTSFDAAGVPNLLWAGMKHKFGWQQKPAYTLQDMAQDALGVLSALQVTRAHVVGVSMGGMIAQHVALTAPDKVLSLTSIMSSSGAEGLPAADPEVLKKMFGKPRQPGLVGALEHSLGLLQAIASPAFAQDAQAVRERVMAAMQRSYRPAGVARQTLAVMSDTARADLLKQLRVPTLVVHGKADPLVPYACGEDTVHRIPGSRLLGIEGMGHDLPPAVVARLLEALVPFFNEHP